MGEWHVSQKAGSGGSGQNFRGGIGSWVLHCITRHYTTPHRAMPHCSSLHYVALFSYSLSSSLISFGAMSLAGLLPYGAEDFGDQTEIVLSGRQIDDTIVRAIAEELKTNRTLTVLDLQSNYITAGGAAQLCDALRLNRSLKELGLANNSLGGRGRGGAKQPPGHQPHPRTHFAG